jgi:uncharacterized membrane protein YkvA (DUF1232 family)
MLHSWLYVNLRGGTIGMEFFKKLVDFIKAVATDERIPDRDKKLLLVLTALVISPVDIIPDWIPILGQMDDLLIIAIVLDYLFNVLDTQILLSHYPWGMKSFQRIRLFARMIAMLTPGWVKKRIWKYEGSPYKG